MVEEIVKEIYINKWRDKMVRDQKKIFRKRMRREEAIRIREDHGGYKAGICRICGSGGWVDQIKHHPNCPVNTNCVYIHCIFEEGRY